MRKISSGRYFRNRLIELNEQGADTLIDKLTLSATALRTTRAQNVCVQTEALLGDPVWRKNIQLVNRNSWIFTPARLRGLRN